MGTYNSTTTTARCPRCSRTAEFDVYLYFGNTTRMTHVSIGEPYPFFDRRAPQNGGPIPTDLLGEGYSVCPHCGKDFFCGALVEDGRLVRVLPVTTQLPYDPDTETCDEMKCPSCGATDGTRLQIFSGYERSRFDCSACNSFGEVKASSEGILSSVLQPLRVLHGR